MLTVLFDIDRTLINSRGAGAYAIRQSFSALFGIDRPAPVAFAGRTDRAIASDLFAAHSLVDDERNWQRFVEDYVPRLSQALPQFRGHVLPGVCPLLDVLSGHGQVALGLLTGNVQPAARLKLEHFGLHHFFHFGGFGDRHHCRDQVARQARRAAQRFLGPRYDPGRLWVVGDTVHDITCGRAIGAGVIAVLTGDVEPSALASHQPDLLIEDLADLPVVLRAMGLRS